MSDLLNVLSALLREEHIEVFAAMPLDRCRMTYPALLSRVLPEAKTVILFLIPYRTEEKGEKRNISLYAVPKDYHLYCRALTTRLCGALHEAFPEGDFCGFADHSPIDERDAAVCAGLGVPGDNGLLINERYGSYVFLCEIYTDLPFAGTFTPGEKKECLHCGACRSACPANGECFSAVTQKKGDLTGEETALLRKEGCAWGCDRCQEVCPLNRDTEETPIAFFREDRIPFLTAETVERMTDGEFAERAYAWRGRKTILRNLRLLEDTGN